MIIPGIVDLTIARGASGIAAYLADGSGSKPSLASENFGVVAIDQGPVETDGRNAVTRAIARTPI
jgi:hypothetical protein